MTPAAIRDGFEHLRSDQQMLPLADAARCRSEADWLVGINGTRAMTAFNSRDGRLLPHHRRPGADADALDHGRARGADQEARLARLLGGARHLRRRRRRVRGQVVRPGVEEEPRRRRAALRPALERGRRPGHRRGGAGRAGRGDRGGQAEHPGAAAALRPDQPAARGELALRLLGPHHAVDRPGAVREAQGADLSADRQPRTCRRTTSPSPGTRWR